VCSRRRDQQDDRDRRADQGGVVDGHLAVVEPLEALLEREDEQEREQNLRPRHREAVLLDELAPLLVEVVFPPAHGLYVPPTGPG
jgi:hypothetical protein